MSLTPENFEFAHRVVAKGLNKFALDRAKAIDGVKGIEVDLPTAIKPQQFIVQRVIPIDTGVFEYRGILAVLRDVQGIRAIVQPFGFTKINREQETVYRSLSPRKKVFKQILLVSKDGSQREEESLKIELQDILTNLWEKSSSFYAGNLR